MPSVTELFPAVVLSSWLFHITPKQHGTLGTYLHLWIFLSKIYEMNFLCYFLCIFPRLFIFPFSCFVPFPYCLEWKIIFPIDFNELSLITGHLVTGNGKSEPLKRADQFLQLFITCPRMIQVTPGCIYGQTNSAKSDVSSRFGFYFLNAFKCFECKRIQSSYSRQRSISNAVQLN